MKYFEENKYKGNDLIHLHCIFSVASSVALNNLFFHGANDEGNDDADAKENRTKLVKSAYSVIAVCEAIIDLVPEEERADALNEIREMVKPIESVEMFEKLLKTIFR